MFMPKRVPSRKCSGSAALASRKVPDPSMSGCFEASARTAKISSAGAGIVRLTETMRSDTGAPSVGSGGGSVEGVAERVLEGDVAELVAGGEQDARVHALARQEEGLDELAAVQQRRGEDRDAQHGGASEDRA